MHGPSRRILVVDDDESIREMCRDVLSAAGYEVDTAAEGLEGLGKISNGSFDLVISDVNMPELDGLELYDSAVARRPELAGRFLLMTGMVTREVERKAAQARVSCLPKPFRITELVGRVEGMMRGAMEGLLSGSSGGMRREGRLKIRGECVIAHEGGTIRAETLDLSRAGAALSHRGEPFTGGALVKASISMMGMHLERGATVAWSRKAGEASSVSGLSFREPAPVSWIVNLGRGPYRT